MRKPKLIKIFEENDEEGMWESHINLTLINIFKTLLQRLLKQIQKAYNTGLSASQKLKKGKFIITFIYD